MTFEVISYLSILLRGVDLTAQSIMVGGLIFLLLIAWPLTTKLGSMGPSLATRCERLTRWAGLTATLLAVARIGLQLSTLMAAANVPFMRAVGASFVIAWGVKAIAGVTVAGLIAYGARTGIRVVLIIAAAATLGGSIATSHAMGRLEYGTELAILTALHEAGAAAWIGGLPCFLTALAMLNDGHAHRLVGRRYSLISMAGVASIAVAGGALAFTYIGSWEALSGTPYGLMTGVKTVLFLGLLGLGGMNYRVVERLRRDPNTPILRLQRFVKAEFGVGIAVLFVAASLTSVPPAVDLVTSTRHHATSSHPHGVRDQLLSTPEHGTSAVSKLQAEPNAKVVGIDHPRAEE